MEAEDFSPVPFICDKEGRIHEDELNLHLHITAGYIFTT